MKDHLHRKPWPLLLCCALGLVQTCNADGLAPGDPDELLPMGITVIVWPILLATALTGLRLIRRSHDLLPPP